VKIMLIQPPLDVSDNVQYLKSLDDDDNTLVSIGLYSMAALLRESGFEVSLVNHTTTPWREAIAEVQTFEPALVGITCLSHNRHAVMRLADALKERMASVKIALGGIHASSLFSLILRKHRSVDYIAIGEGELSFLELSRRLAAGESTTGIKGIVQRKQGVDYSRNIMPVAVAGTCAEFTDFDWVGHADTINNLEDLPIPAKYYKYNIVSTARGCPFKCTFCSSPQIWGRNVRNRPVEHVIEELLLLRDRHGVDLVYFKDETFTMSKKRVIELCKAMIDAGLHLRWSCDTRTDCLSDEVLYWMRKAGCFYVSLGVESGSEAMLSQIDKKTDLEKIRRGSALVRKYGLLMRFYIIANLPDETNDDRQDSIDLIEECKPNFVSVTLLKLSPSTELYRRYCRENSRDDNVWFDDKRFWIPYREDEEWVNSAVGRKLLSYKYDTEKAPQFGYTESELRDMQARMSDCFLPNHDLALFLLRNNRASEAIPYYQLAMKIWSDYINGWIGLGICYLNVNRPREARDLFAGLSEKTAGNPEIWYRLGVAHALLDEAIEAEKCFRKVLMLNKNHIPAMRLLGRLLAIGGRRDEALDQFRRILVLDPANSQAASDIESLQKAMGAVKQQSGIRLQLHGF
jgi:radical SAM superfamily enzyme YgiQ (UPF0313 family)